jgi:GntR family transcriptional regulator
MSLSKKFGVSRMTVRRAIEDLVREGILIRKWGEGTIVSSSKVVRDYTRLTAFHEDAKNRGLKPSSKMISKEVIEADQKNAKLLSIKERDKLFHLLRIRLTENLGIVALHELFIPVSICPWIDTVDLEESSLYTLYEVHQLKIEWGSQIVEARLPTNKQSELLEISSSTPVLYSDRISYTHNNIPVERVIAVSPGDKFSLNLVMKR